MNGQSSPVCPVCGGSGEPLLSLRNQAIYQHPVPVNAVVPEPHAIDLKWSTCSKCAHAWQPDFDEAVLREIYRSHYYTPAPAGIGVQFRNDFLAALDTFGLNKTRRVLLEIGASDGDVLAELRTRTNASRAYAFEPNKENASIARQRGIDVRERFFGADAVADKLDPVDFIYARHVIEHVFDFTSFFRGINGVVSAGADLILETPSLDFHAMQGSMDPFHIEHVHVFALCSLVMLAGFHGWRYGDSVVTASGNLIASFRKGGPPRQIPKPDLGGLQARLSQHSEAMRRLFAGRRIIFWGAGSAGIALANAIGREPDIWTDGNPNKIGKKFVGSTCSIVSPESAMAAGASSASEDPIVVITSSFRDEILPRIRQLGWSGAVFDAAGKRL
jgi:hypothetical protein